MTHPSRLIEQALGEWAETLGSDAVLTGLNATELYRTNELSAKRDIAAVLKPRGSSQLVAAVRTARKCGLPLYPVSTGCNWGYGAASPVVDDCVVVDLSKMNQIVDFDEELGLVTVQPGVTPRQLRDFLDARRSRWLVPVSGAGPQCSLIGNALERGYGVTPYVDHFSAVTSIEAVLPDGEIYRSALSAAGGAEIDQAFKWGVGPYLDGIFSQGAFGIVTEMTIALAPIPEEVVAFIFSLKAEEDLEPAIIAVHEILKSVGNVLGSINLMNGHRMLAMVEDYPFNRVEKGSLMTHSLVDDLLKKNFLGRWTLGGIVYGDRGLVKSAISLIKRRSAGIKCRKLFFNRKRINLLKAVARRLPGSQAAMLRKQLGNLDDAFNVAEGAPTETALKLCYWKSGQRPPEGQLMNPARDGCGVIWYSPLVPMKPEKARAYVDMVYRVCAEHRIEPLITLTSLSHRCFDSTVPILFDPRHADDTARAKKCYEALFEAGKELGVLPYRVGIDHMGLIVRPDSTYWKLVARLKEAIDPGGIIAPGRYCPTDHPHGAPECRLGENS
ncbi:MAG: FAD-binding oxidoreductase [Candidatus Krumholzibacteria bacterium]|nr:FAD-binding oxidoreductase [Candidatus Krumholzibacteria bacterium]